MPEWKVDIIMDMVKLCMFDMGGVVSKHDDGIMERKILHYLGRDDVKRFSDLDPTIMDDLDLMSARRIDENEFWLRFSRKTGIAIPKQTESLWGRFFGPEMDTGTVEILKELKQTGMRLALASNTEPPHKAYHMSHGQYDVFDDVFTSLDLGYVKPDTRFYQAILDKEKLQPEEIFFTDDMAANINKAKEMGFIAYQFTTAEALREKLESLGLLSKKDAK